MTRPWWRVAVVVLAAAAALTPVPPPLVERYYSRGFYAHLQPVVTLMSSAVPVAMLDIAAGLFVVLSLLLVARRWRRAGVRHAIRGAAAGALVLSAVAYLWFLLFWGLNYRRVPLTERLAYDPSRVNPSAAVEAARAAVRRVNESASSFGDQAPLEEALTDAFAEVESLLGSGFHARVARPKHSLLTWYFRRASIDGMTNPFFLEIILNPDLLPAEQPFTLAHEWAHLAGYAEESDANFVAWLTCIRADGAVKYSGWLQAYLYLSNAVPRNERRSLRDALHQRARDDLAAIDRRLARANPVVSSAARQAYDSYLRANRVEDGVASYGRVVRLMLGTEFDGEWRHPCGAKWLAGC